MADNFGLKIGIEGEKEFKKALSEINQSFKVLGSEMKLVSSQFDSNDKSIQALSAREYRSEQGNRRPAPEDRNAAGCPPERLRVLWENDRRTQNWQIQLNNAEAALNGMEQELSANERAIESLSRQETGRRTPQAALSGDFPPGRGTFRDETPYSNAVLEYGKGSSRQRNWRGAFPSFPGTAGKPGADEGRRGCGGGFRRFAGGRIQRGR